jgi:hypothetical protein
MKTAKETKPMITDKDMKEAKAIIKAERDDKGFTVESIAALFARIRVESAEQARKEAAGKVGELASIAFNANMRTPEGYKKMVADFTAILGDSTTVSTDSEKLAIAAKVLEEILYRHGLEAGVAADCCHIANTALKEIQE